MEKKSSKYNVYLEEDGQYFIFNQLTGAFTGLTKEIYTALKEKQPLEGLEKDEEEFLCKSNFLCDSDLNEELVVLKRNRIRRYGNHSARITIMPTLNCNFKCWYCYESHIESQMDEQTKNSIILFVKNIIEQNKLKSFELDWFGGEPLMYFNEVMYDIGKAIMELCKEENIRFYHGITTNGYLITPEMVEKFKEIGLNSFQITLDGSEKYHNKTRFSTTDKKTYTTIVNNITLLCRELEVISLSLRINYTPKSASTLDEIAKSFPEDVRGKINVNPQIVWQYKDSINPIDDNIHDKLKVFAEAGYRVENSFVGIGRNVGCYVENSLQFVINYDGSLYKCTARDFTSKKHSIGNLNENGQFISNNYFYNYFMSSYFENPDCLQCELLPSCSGMCLQAKIEQAPNRCPRQSIENSLANQLKLIIQKNKKETKETEETTA